MEEQEILKFLGTGYKTCSCRKNLVFGKINFEVFGFLQLKSLRKNRSGSFALTQDDGNFSVNFLLDFLKL